LLDMRASAAVLRECPDGGSVPLRQENRSRRKTGLGGMEVAKAIQGCRLARTALRQAGSETARAAPVWA
jgi:hypothetical protein